MDLLTTGHVYFPDVGVCTFLSIVCVCVCGGGCACMIRVSVCACLPCGVGVCGWPTQRKMNAHVTKRQTMKMPMFLRLYILNPHPLFSLTLTLTNKTQPHAQQCVGYAVTLLVLSNMRHPCLSLHLTLLPCPPDPSPPWYLQYTLYLLYCYPWLCYPSSLGIDLR